MRPDELKTRIFLDGGDPVETREIKNLLGFLDGQTTNPTLVAKNPEARKRLEQGAQHTENELLDFYRLVVNTIADTIPHGSISIEVFADAGTTADAMLRQAQRDVHLDPERPHQVPHVARRTEGGAAGGAGRDAREHDPLLLAGAGRGRVRCNAGCEARGRSIVSPFIGRLDDIGENGMDVIANILGAL